MCAQQKKPGWFFNKTGIEKITDEAEVENKVTKLSEKIASKQSQEIAELKRVILEKEKELHQYQQSAAQKNQHLINENENYKQILLRWEEEQRQEVKQIQALETSLQRMNADGHQKEQVKAAEDLQMQLQQLEAERVHLLQMQDRLTEVHAEIKETRQQCQLVIHQQKDRELQRYKKIIELEKKIDELLLQLDAKDELWDQKEAIIREKEYQVSRLQQAGRRREAKTKVDITEWEKLLAEKRAENNQLKNEIQQAQQETAEVLDLARKQARKIVGSARSEAQQIEEISAAKAEKIYAQAEGISCEVIKTQPEIVKIFDELQDQVAQLKTLNSQ
ncbi:hypothetical protein P7H00_10115 [Enterococcus pseudoavium]|uniref:Uncharacterized protein n=2 Tax=Enterococcus pseudoavium TaxID=44007 RepID=A0AAE4I266_9ENTE|nr:hypothetical protein [Enterococcus pseudoavium]MDT2737483.1 hypothetical protein [Enterococcus pseudoavium]